MINIVLYEPEIPENTGNIMRTAVAFDATLHLIRPFGFIFDEKRLKRSGAGYIDKVKYKIYDDYEDFINQNQGKYYYFTRYGHNSPDKFNFCKTEEKIYLIFGKESTGIPKELLKGHIENCIRIPTTDGVRSLNLSNCVAIGVYEVIKQQNYAHLLTDEPFKGKDYLERE